MHLVARDIMNPEVLCAREDWSISKLAEFLSEHAITGAPVADEAGNILGVVSVSDIARYACRHLMNLKSPQGPSDYFVSGWENRLNPEDLTAAHIEEATPDSVKAIMTPVVYSVEEDCPIFEMAGIMVRRRIHRLLVTRGNLLVGIVTTLDLLKILAKLG